MSDLLRKHLGVLDNGDLVALLLDGAIFYAVVYFTLKVLKGTRAMPMVLGVLVLVALSQTADPLGFLTTGAIFDRLSGSLIVVVVILFQSDFRRILAKFSLSGVLGGVDAERQINILEELVQACRMLAEEKIGGLMGIGDYATLERFIEEGTRVDAPVSKQLLFAIFNPERRNPLHDGAVMITDGEIKAAGCFVPLSSNPAIDKTLGTRHRAGIGLSEETTAVVLIVSEETGKISIAMNGQIFQDIAVNDLRSRLQEVVKKRSFLDSLKGAGHSADETSTGANRA